MLAVRYYCMLSCHSTSELFEPLHTVASILHRIDIFRQAACQIIFQFFQKISMAHHIVCRSLIFIPFRI